MSFIKLISLFYYNPKVCFSDPAPNIIYSKTDECCPITYSCTWTVIEFCLRTLMHCLNKPDGALKHSSRTGRRPCVCETDSQLKREFWAAFCPSAEDSWKVRICFSLNLFCISGVICHVTCTSKDNQDLCVWESKLFRNVQVTSNPSTQTHRKWGKAGTGCDSLQYFKYYKTTILQMFWSHLFLSLPAGQCKLWQPQIFFLPVNSYTESCRTKLCTESNPVHFL